MQLLQAVHPIDWKSFWMGVGSGFFVQFIWILCLQVRNAYILSKFGGQYDICFRQMDGSLLTTGGIVKLKYRMGHRFQTTTRQAIPERDWEGVLRLEKFGAHVTGEGTYSYLHRDDTGVHRVLLSPNTRCFNVTAENTSHPAGEKDTKLVWRPRW